MYIENKTLLQAARETIKTLPDHQPTQEEIDEQIQISLLKIYRDNKVNPDPEYSKILAAIFEDSGQPVDDEEEFPEVAELCNEGLRFIGNHFKHQIVVRESEILESGFRFRALYESGEISDEDLISLMADAWLLGDLEAMNGGFLDSLKKDVLLPHHYSIFKKGIISTYLTFNRKTETVDEIAGLVIGHETLCPHSSPLTKQKDNLLGSEGLSKIYSSKVGVLYCLEAARRVYSKRQNYSDLDDFFDV